MTCLIIYSDLWNLKKFSLWSETDLFVRTSIWLRSLVMLSDILSICFLGRSDRRRIFCRLQTGNSLVIFDELCIVCMVNCKQRDYLAVAVPKRTANSWYLSSCFSIKFRWLLTPQIIIWSVSNTCICAPSLSLCILFCRSASQRTACWY